MKLHEEERKALLEKHFPDISAGEGGGITLRRLKQADGLFVYYQLALVTHARYVALPEDTLKPSADLLIKHAANEAGIRRAIASKEISAWKARRPLRKLHSYIKKDLAEIMAEGEKELVKIAYRKLCMAPEVTGAEAEARKEEYTALTSEISPSIRRKIEAALTKEAVLQEEDNEAPALSVLEEPETIEESLSDSETIEEPIVEEPEKEESVAAEPAATEPSVEEVVLDEPAPEPVSEEPVVPSPYQGIRPKEESGILTLTAANLSDASQKEYAAAVLESTLVHTKRAYAIEDSKEVFRCTDALLSLFWQQPTQKAYLTDNYGALMVVTAKDEASNHGTVLIQFQKISENAFVSSFELRVRDSVDEFSRRVCTATVLRQDLGEQKLTRLNLDGDVADVVFEPLREQIKKLELPLQRENDEEDRPRSRRELYEQRDYR